MAEGEFPQTPRREQGGSGDTPSPIRQPLLTPKQQLELLPKSGSDRLRLKDYDAMTSGGSQVLAQPDFRRLLPLAHADLRRIQSVPNITSPHPHDDSSHGDSTMEGSSEGLEEYVASTSNSPEQPLRQSQRSAKRVPSNIEEFLDQLIEDAQKPRSPFQSIRKRPQIRRGRDTQSLNNICDPSLLEPPPNAPLTEKNGKRGSLDRFFNKRNRNKKERPTEAHTATGDTSVVSLTIDGQAKTFTVGEAEAKLLQSFLNSSHESPPPPPPDSHRSNQIPGDFLDGRQQKHTQGGGDAMPEEGDRVSDNLRFQGKSTQELLDMVELQKRRMRVRYSRPPVTVNSERMKGLGDFLDKKSMRRSRVGEAMTVEGDRVAQNHRFQGKSTQEFMDYVEAEKSRKSSSAPMLAQKSSSKPDLEHFLDKRASHRSSKIGDAVTVEGDRVTSNARFKDTLTKEILDMIESEKRRISRIAKKDDSPQQVVRRRSSESSKQSGESAKQLVGMITEIIESDRNKNSRKKNLEKFFDTTPMTARNGSRARSVGAKSVGDGFRSHDQEFTSPRSLRASSTDRKKYSSPRVGLRRMEKKEWTTALAQAPIQDDKSKPTRSPSLPRSRQWSNSSRRGQNLRSQSLNFLSDTLADDQSIEQDKGINTTAEAGKGLRRGRKPGVQKESEDLQNDIGKARRASRKGVKKKVTDPTLQDQEKLDSAEKTKQGKKRSKSKGKKGKTLKKDKHKFDVQADTANTESSGSNTTENAPAKGYPAAIDRLSLKNLPRQKEIKFDDVEKPRSQSTISLEDSELDDREVGQRFLLAERVRSLTNDSLPDPSTSPNDRNKALPDRVTEKEKAAIEDSQEFTPPYKKKSRKRGSKKSPKFTTPNAESRKLDLDHGTPIIARPGESEYPGVGNTSLALQLPFTKDVNEANSNTLSNKGEAGLIESPSIPVRKTSFRPSTSYNNSSGRKRDKLTSPSVKAGDVVALDDDGDTVVSDITEAGMISSMSSAEFTDSFRRKWEPGMVKISESDQLSHSDHKEKSQSTRGISLHLYRRWQSAHDIHSPAKSPKTPIRRGSNTLSDSFKGKLEADIGMISDDKKKSPSTPKKSPSSPSLMRGWQSARDIHSPAKSPKTPIRKESHTLSASFRGKRKPGIGIDSESDQKEKSRSNRGRSLHLMRRKQSTPDDIHSAPKSPKTPIRKESLVRRWQSARDIHSPAKSPKTPKRKESLTLSDSLRGKRKPGIEIISESDQLSHSDHKEKSRSRRSLQMMRRWQSARDISPEAKAPKTPILKEKASTPARSLHLVRRWQSALDIPSAVNSPKTPMREESERGKTSRFEWVKKKIPFAKRR